MLLARRKTSLHYAVRTLQKMQPVCITFHSIYLFFIPFFKFLTFLIFFVSRIVNYTLCAYLYNLYLLITRKRIPQNDHVDPPAMYSIRSGACFEVDIKYYSAKYCSCLAGSQTFACRSQKTGMSHSARHCYRPFLVTL